MLYYDVNELSLLILLMDLGVGKIDCLDCILDEKLADDNDTLPTDLPIALPLFVTRRLAALVCIIN